MTGDTDLSHMVRTLVAVARELGEQLADGRDFEASLACRNRYNDAFGRFQVAVAGGAVIGPELAHDLSVLDQVHTSNMNRVAELKEFARDERGAARTFRSHIGGYAPNGADHVPIARFIDGAA
ncbi:MAG: hypothetical protein JWN41_1563 [Thermoleophilia bacterium]|nr:hypothetical protein [Thermoleophilia bacterium]